MSPAAESSSWSTSAGAKPRPRRPSLASVRGSSEAVAAAVQTTTSEDPRTLAREGLLGLGFAPAEVDQLLDSAAGDTPEDLIAAALRAAR